MEKILCYLSGRIDKQYFLYARILPYNYSETPMAFSSPGFQCQPLGVQCIGLVYTTPQNSPQPAQNSESGLQGVW